MALIFDTSLDINGKPVKPVEVDQSFNPTSTNAQSGVAVKEAIDQAVEGIYKPAGSLLFANLPSPSADVLGFVYNVIDAFTTDARFVEGAGTKCAAGTNVVVVNTGTSQSPVYKFDILAAGAVQVQSDWTQTDTSAVDYIKNKPTIPTVNNGTLLISQNGVLKGVFTANSSTNVDVLLENLPADFINNQNTAQTATTPLKVWEGTSSDYADQSASTGTFYAWDMTSGGWTGYTMEYPITNSSVIYWYADGDYGPTSNTIIYTNGTSTFVRDDYEEFRYAPEKNIVGSNIGPDTVCFVEGVGVKTGAGIDIANLSSGSTTAEEIVNANEATGATSPLKVWQGTEQEWTNGVGTNWYNWRTDAAFGVKQSNNFSSVQDLTYIVSDQNIYIGYKYSTANYIYSTDGVNWSSGTFPSPVGHCRCVDNGFIFTNQSDDSKIMFSSDGINWTEVTLASATWSNCAYGNGTYVLVSNRQGASIVAISQNGVDWTIKTLYSGSVGTLTGIAFGNGTFVVVRGVDGGQQLYYSEDNGSTWKTDYNINPSYQMGYPVFSKGKFIVTGYNSNKAAYSTDGKNWTTVNLPSSGSWRLNLSTENAFLAYDYTTTAAYSTDGVTWNSVNLPNSGSMCSCFNKFITKDGKDLYYSIDGNNWFSLDLGSNFASSTKISKNCKKEIITASNTTTDYATLGDIFSQCYTLEAEPATASAVYSEPNTASALTITSVDTGAITLSDNNTYTYTSSGDVTTYQTIGDAYPNYLANINGIGVKIGNTLIADNTDTSTLQTKSNLVTSVSSSSTDTQYPSAKLLYDTVGNIEATLDAIIAQGSNS